MNESTLIRDVHLARCMYVRNDSYLFRQLLLFWRVRWHYLQLHIVFISSSDFRLKAVLNLLFLTVNSFFCQYSSGLSIMQLRFIFKYVLFRLEQITQVFLIQWSLKYLLCGTLECSTEHRECAHAAKENIKLLHHFIFLSVHVSLPWRPPWNLFELADTLKRHLCDCYCMCFMLRHLKFALFTS